MGHRNRIYFLVAGWFFLALIAMSLNTLNIDWENTKTWQGLLLILITGALQGNVLQIVVTTVATMMIRYRLQPDKRADFSKLTLLLNYNLLAIGKDEIDETYQSMYEAYITNLHPNVSAVLVSATTDIHLKQYELYVRDRYREHIFNMLMKEGTALAHSRHSEIDQFRLVNVWKQFSNMPRKEFLHKHLKRICEAYAMNFMCIHRIHRVLKKCGQYQDLMLLSYGENLAYTYTDPYMYGSMCRPHNELVFQDSQDVDNIKGKNYTYTLVLDGDTRVTPGTALHLLAIAAANPGYAIIQPSIIMDVGSDDTIFMHLEKVRQDINETVTKSMAYLLGQCGFYGKALIKNSAYIQNVIGTRDNLIERVPIDVLSHDTFEAAVLKPYYASSAQLLETPPYNYISWDIRERRWNKGEVILAFYFWPNMVGKPARLLQKYFQKEKFVPTKLRTESKMDFVSTYIAHSTVRQMSMKPLLLLYFIVQAYTSLFHRHIPFILVMFFVVIFPNLAKVTKSNWKLVIVENIASIIQFTPEAIVGCVRIAHAIQANISQRSNWTPQRAVEEELRRRNPFLVSLKHLWGYSFFALVTALVFSIGLNQSHYVLFFMLTTLFILPLYTGLTSYTLDLRRPPVDIRWVKEDSSESLV